MLRRHFAAAMSITAMILLAVGVPFFTAIGIYATVSRVWAQELQSQESYTTPAGTVYVYELQRSQAPNLTCYGTKTQPLLGCVYAK